MGKVCEILDARWKKWGILGLKRSKNMVLIGNKAMEGGALVKAPEGKWGGNGGEMGKLNQSTLAPQFLLFAPPPPFSSAPQFHFHLARRPPANSRGPNARSPDPPPPFGGQPLCCCCIDLHLSCALDGTAALWLPPPPPITHHFPPFSTIFPGTGYITGTLLGILPPTSSGYF